MQNIDTILQHTPLVQLIQEENFVGWIYSIDYDTALVMTNDLWKTNALGIPHNCFLVAASFNPKAFASSSQEEREVILLRVISSAKLPQDDDLVRAKIDHFQRQTEVYRPEGARDYDDITRNQMQFGGLECRVLGTFYEKDNELWLGSDLESFVNAARLNVYRPRGEALKIIVNHVDPLRRQAALEEAAELGLSKPVDPFQIGTVRYTSTARLHRGDEKEMVAVCIQPSDFLARRTAVLGMTRTGKSNMVKQMVSVVKKVADEGGITIGQIIYDINGEYANANRQDKGAIADVFPEETIRYRTVETEGFQEIRNNFYEQLQEGFATIIQDLEESGGAKSDYIRLFMNLSLDQPDRKEYAEFSRWRKTVAAYKALLYKAGFSPPENHKVHFEANGDILEAVNSQAGYDFPDPDVTGLTVKEACEWFEAARAANQVRLLKTKSGKPWIDETLSNLLDMLVQKNQNGAYISGHRILANAVKYHSPRRSRDVAEEIYVHLSKGKIVILDLSVGNPRIRERVSKQIATKIFDRSMRTFIEGKQPPHVVVYIEEAHNLIGKDKDLTDTWPRLAKEGAKYRIALVYATQEVSSVHPNILSNTENWFITHLNNEREIRELARFYDFEDFSRSLIRAQDVGFARVKTLSGPFVIPVQIDKFDPQIASSRKQASSKKRRKEQNGQSPSLWGSEPDSNVEVTASDSAEM
jgi:hypothetical protein